MLSCDRNTGKKSIAIAGFLREPHNKSKAVKAERQNTDKNTKDRTQTITNISTAWPKPECQNLFFTDLKLEKAPRNTI